MQSCDQVLVVAGSILFTYFFYSLQKCFPCPC